MEYRKKYNQSKRLKKFNNGFVKKKLGLNKNAFSQLRKREICYFAKNAGQILV
jgi:hypothetical protein